MRMTSIFFAATTFALATLAFNASAGEQAMNHDSMSGMSMSEMAPAPTNTVYSGTGVIKSWSDSAVSISHHPIAALNWPAMTMSFDLTGYTGARFTAGQQVDFTFRQTDSGYALVSAQAK